MDTASPAPPLVMASLTVSRRALLATLRSLARLTRPDSAGDAILSLVDGTLEIAIGGAVGSVAAAGRWPGACRVSGRWLRSLVTALPAGDPVLVQVTDGMLACAHSRSGRRRSPHSSTRSCAGMWT